VKKLWIIEWKSIPLDRKIELVLIVGGMVIAALVLINNGTQLEQMSVQTKAMQDQLVEMKSGSADTKVLAQSTKTQADNTGKLADAATDSAKTAKISMIASGRAYVHYIGPRWISHLDPQGHIFWRIRPQWINVGNTPTRDLRIYTQHALRDDKLPLDFTFIPEKYGPAAIFSKGMIESSLFDIHGSDLAAISKSKKHLYIWGIAIYRDVFPGTPEHVTKFFVKAGNISGNPLLPWDEKRNPFEIMFMTEPQHNCTDEDCDRDKYK
jgi:hypothetical protein